MYNSYACQKSIRIEQRYSLRRPWGACGSFKNVVPPAQKLSCRYILKTLSVTKIRLHIFVVRLGYARWFARCYIMKIINNIQNVCGPQVILKLIIVSFQNSIENCTGILQNPYNCHHYIDSSHKLLITICIRMLICYHFT